MKSGKAPFYQLETGERSVRFLDLPESAKQERPLLIVQGGRAGNHLVSFPLGEITSSPFQFTNLEETYLFSSIDSKSGLRPVRSAGARG